ncbi:coenzyme q10 biosynthesis protein-like protein [Sarcoptes scabiei]|uniref:Coenzyme q10 biosynthesis protein-like protein n=1 Tax=Sarcoptes scabiei TaxID=52283 RepID=A0A132A583_SARSC|nr:coenzyme q10 biosynthesis protein-like protein [Sarcoptes scabiei]
MARYLARARRELLASFFQRRIGRRSYPFSVMMWMQEIKHFQYCSKQLVLLNGRKSFLTPLWELCSLTLGYTSGMLGKQASMAATVAVEKTISEHYDNQIRALLIDDIDAHREVIADLSQIRDDEQDHHDLALANDAENTFGYDLFSSIISNGCKIAIQIAQRI